MWKLVLTTESYYYWQHQDGYYNCTKENIPPEFDCGYWQLTPLRKMKNDLI